MKRRGKFFGFDHLKSPTYVPLKTYGERAESDERIAYIREHCRRGNWSAIYTIPFGEVNWTPPMISRFYGSSRKANLSRLSPLASGIYDIYAFEDADDAVFFKLRFA